MKKRKRCAQEGRDGRLRRYGLKTAAALCACGLFVCAFAAALRAQEEERPRIGVCVYNASVRKGIVEAAADGKAELIVGEDVRDQNLQTRMIQDMIEQNADVLIVNVINRTSAVYLIRMAEEAKIPIILVNTEPLQEELLLYEDAYYIGSNPVKIGQMCGQIAVDYYFSHPEMDKNKDGILQTVLLKGQVGHQDAEYRTKYCLETLENAGIPVEILAEDTAEWERDVAREKMAVELEIYGPRIECVICNNDQMALGAIDALRTAGYYQNGEILPVIGVDGLTASARNALEEGTLIGTVLNDTQSQGKISYQLACELAKGMPEQESIGGYPIEEGHYIWITGSIITQQSKPQSGGI